MPNARTPEQVAVSFHKAATEAGVVYAFMGAIAVSAWGQPRSTADVDCLVHLPAEQDQAFKTVLKKHGFSLDPADLVDARTDKSHVTVFDDRGGYHVDMKLATTPQEQDEVHEAAELDLPPGRIRVVRAEETLAFKISFGSEQDLKDARSIIIRQKDTLDENRLMEHASRLGVGDEVKRLLNDYRSR